MPKADEMETWKANGRVVLKRYNRLGAMETVLLNTNKTINLTAEERMLNQDDVYEEQMDPFANGTLSAVRLPESSKESTQAIVDNPNTMTEEELVETLKGHHKTFEKKLGEISSPYVVKRMVAMAQADEEDELGVSVKRMEQLESRLQELTMGDINVINHVGSSDPGNV